MGDYQGVNYYNAHSKDTVSAGPWFQEYECGWCHRDVHGRLVAQWTSGDGRSSQMLCACACGGPTALVLVGGGVARQAPAPQEFKPSESWPKALSKLYDEAASSYSAGAYTASAMVCRKVLMACACEQGDEDGQSFAHYVDYITTNVLTYPRAKTSIDEIRRIGNDANHDITFVTQPDAETAMRIITYLLDALYAFPQAHAPPANTAQAEPNPKRNP